MAVPWRKRLHSRIPPFVSRLCVSVTSCLFRGERNGVWVGLSQRFSHFPLLQIPVHRFSTLIPFICFHYISFVPVMMRQAWSAGILSFRRYSTIGASSHPVAYLEFVSGGGVRPLPLVLRGQFLLNYNNFLDSENTISEHMAIFKKNICKFFKYL